MALVGQPSINLSSRNKLGERFIPDLYADWLQGGIDAIKKVRETQPAAYLRVIVSVLPKQLEIKSDPFDELPPYS